MTAGKREFLFNVASEEHETINLIKRYPDKAKELNAKLKNWTDGLQTPGIPEGDLKAEKVWFGHYFPEVQ